MVLNYIQASAISVSQFEFYGPVKGIVLFNLVFLIHLLFSIHIAFGKCKYCSLFFFNFFVDFKPLMKAKTLR